MKVEERGEGGIPERIRRIKPFLAMEILERAQELEARGRNIIHLEIGEPDFDTPQCIKDACIRVLRESRPAYTHSLGLLELREEICREFEEKHRVSVSPDRILVTSGTSPAMLLAFSVLCHSGDEVVLTDPHYPCYPSFIQYAGAKGVFVPVQEENGFQYTLDGLRTYVSSRTRAILVNSPANPTGTVTPPMLWEGLARLGPTIVSDEIYHGLVYGEPAHSALEFSENVFVLNGFSKLYAMTGWRLGYVVAPKAHMRALQTLHQNFFISANSFVQRAALIALREASQEVEAMRLVYDQRRKLLLEGLRNLGFGIRAEPTGAYYILANIRAFSEDSMQFALDLLEEAGVGVTPGIDFGANGEGYVRFTYANSEENLEEALHRVRLFLQKRMLT
jgi:(5-formylfuran-3-yl)methyl phosphate transaminase